ncbi:Disease resistance protein [Cinnamomum micranthum f. kanehirae]|uniref:Disease resistance protein n=1 Tax=Cinnamomum micranthum f. kanehirae TaxID=337451 RepID=A0A3S3MXB4_9MAGN|nr:Disease resistance protein [Cinnamomum micranthum f. kanehirae]
MSYEAFVSSFAERLGDLLIEEAPLLHRVRDSLQRIQRELKSMQSFLKDAESKQTEDVRVKNWVAQIRDVCYEAEDVIDTFIFSQRAKKMDGFAGRVKRSMFLSEIRTRYKLGRQIQKIKRNISDIKMKRENYGITDISEGRQEASSSSRSLQERRRILVLLEETEVVGQREIINTVKKQLMSDESRRCVISIIGMGGSGKTTLAKKVYHEVKHDFDCYAFVYLSEQFVIKDVLMRILICVMGLFREEGEKLEEEELGNMLRDHLREKRYLLVIDDIWSTQAWERLKRILPADDMNKSRVMLTTRSKDVALHADPSSHPHEMRLLNDDEGWELFMKKIFPGPNSLTACPIELVETGRMILAKCGGLPLAILVLGGLLSRKDKTDRAWSKVFRDLSGSSDRLWRILAFSYWDLPYYLKPCFLYLGLFPEESEIGSRRLIRLWIAEGFIEQRDNQIMEDVAEDFLEELVDRSMIQVASRKSNGSVGKFCVHNLLRDFSLSEARQNNFFAIHNDNGICSSLTSVRRLAFYDRVAEYKISEYKTTAVRLRSIFCFPGSEVPMSKLLKMGVKLLRVLVTEGVEEESFKEVGACVHLRYLELARTIDGSLLSSIGNLSVLQSLKLSFRGTLPNEIWNLEQLRHLSCYGFRTDEHPKLKKLRNLQTLKLSAGSWIGDGLGKLSNLRKLGIRGNLSSHRMALSHSIDKLSNLQSLKLHDGHSIPPFESFSLHLGLYKMHLDGRIQRLPILPPNLTELTLQNSLLRPDAISTLEKLPCLEILRLLHKSYDGKRMICSQGGFPCLEFLTLSELPLECLNVKEGAMRSLKTVELFGMSKLETKTLPERVRSILKQI